MRQHNKELSVLLSRRIPATVKQTIARHFYENERSHAKHNREVLDDIISELNEFRNTLPTVSELEACDLL